MIPILGAAMAQPTPAPVEEPVEAALSFLSTRVDDTGCVHEFDCSVQLTDWTIVAVASAGRDPRSWPPGGTSPVEFLRADPQAHEPNEEQLEATWRARRLLAIVASGEDPAVFGGVDHVQALRNTFQGQFGRPEFINDDMYAVMALRAAAVPSQDPMIAAAVDHIRNAQHVSGGWGHETATVDPSPDMTAAALMALSLAEVPRSSDHVQDGLTFLLENRANDGASPCATMTRESTSPNADSTAWVAMALTAYAIDLRRGPWSVNGASVVDCMLDHQHADGGVGTAARSSTYTTTQAVAAIAGVPHGRATFPLSRPPAEIEVVGEARSDAPVTLRAAGADLAAWAISGQGPLDGTTVTFQPDGPGEIEVELVTWDMRGVANAIVDTVHVEGPGSNDGSGRSDGGGDADVPDTNERPVVERPYLPETVLRRANVTVEMHGMDPDGQVTAWLVDWGDGNQTGWVALDQQTHGYERLGVYDVTVYARDDDGAVSAPATAAVRVVNAPPLPAIEAPTEAPRRTPVSFVDASSDPDGTIAQREWDVGSGWTVGGPTAAYAFDEPGNHTVRLRVTDNDGAARVASATVSVQNAPPTVAAEIPVTVRAGATIELVANASDPEGDAVEIEWTTPYGPGRGERITLYLPDPGNVTLRIAATDAYGATSSIEHTIRVVRADQHAVPSKTVERRSEPDDAPAPRPDTDEGSMENREPVPPVELPDRVTVHPDGGWLEGQVRSGASAVARVEARMGEPLAVDGTDEFKVAIPPLAPGDYELVVRAVDDEGRAGPWSTVTVVVPGPTLPDEELATSTTDGDGPATEPHALPLPALVALAALCIAARRRRR